jgi:hypothetical protein
MLLSMVPVSYGALANLEVNAQDDPQGVVVVNGDKGDDLTVTGTGVTAGKTVELYWDLVQPWSSTTKKGLLNTSTAEASGAFDVWFEIPESVGGLHYLWIRDTETGETLSTQITVDPKTSGSASSGLAGDRVDVKSYGFGKEEDVAIMMLDDDALATVTSLRHTASGAVAPYDFALDACPATVGGDYEEFTLDDAPIKPGSVEITIDRAGGGAFGNTTYTDAGDGTFTAAGALASGTIDYLTGEVTLTFTAAAGPAAAETVDAGYAWFEDTANEPMKVFYSATETNTLGSVTKRVTIPADADFPTGVTYYFWVMNADGDVATDDFAKGPVITLDAEDGPVGTVVEISGRGFDTLDDFDFGDIKIDTASGAPTGDAINCWIDDDPVDVDDDGDFRLEILIPQVDDEDDYVIKVNPCGAGDASPTNTWVDADFEVLGLAEIEVDPGYGVQGSTINIQGWNFTQIGSEDLTLELWEESNPGVSGYDTKVTDIDDYETGSNGEFSGTFTVPARSSKLYQLKAVMDDAQMLISATEEFRIGSVIVILSPTSGPTGTEVILTGTGFTENMDWNATFGDLDLITDGQIDADGNLEDNGGNIPTFYVPTVDPGVYVITVLDIDADIEVEVEFTVTDTTMVMFDPMVAPQDYNITISGKYFTQNAGETLEFVLYNDTDDWDMMVKQFKTTSVDYRNAELDEDGNFTAWWNFNLEALDLDIGTYMVNVTDGEDLFAQFEFQVVTKTSEIDPRKSVFRVGDTLAFNVESSFAQDDSYIKIWDPSGNLYWQTDAFNDNPAPSVWLKVGTIERVPYYEQVAGGNPMTFLDDAPLGTWEWAWYDADDDELDDGTFTVEAAEADVIGQQVEDLNNQITDLASQLTDVSAEFDDVKSDIADVAAIAEQAVTAAQQAAEAVETVAQTANTAGQAAADAATAAEAARDAANGLTTLVYGAIGAALVAALAAIVSLMQISRRIAG